VVLDDSMAMVPSMTLSSFDQVQISARVSKSGQPRAQSGDIQSEAQIVKSNKKEIIKLTINNVVP
ncbi:MAG: c-type cytochrome biogenesis protein CcmI, partial [Gammaproteobacteria bacterium]|nr:c-type cytochrome biogenesis protein CcmI [Gammaproteobacteria bacterium]